MHAIQRSEFLFSFPFLGTVGMFFILTNLPAVSQRRMVLQKHSINIYYNENTVLMSPSLFLPTTIQKVCKHHV